MAEVSRLGAEATVIQRQEMHMVQERGRDSLAREGRRLWCSREELKSAEGEVVLVGTRSTNIKNNLKVTVRCQDMG